jgi:hypothetical protein
MRLTIITMITKPDERQDKWREALQNYLELADEVVCVNGGPHLEYAGVKMLDMPWPDDWDWQELPKHLNFAKEHATGDWILKLDIDQLIHEKEFTKLRKVIETIPHDVDVLSLMKFNFVAKMRYLVKNTQPILFRNKPEIGFGYALDFPNGDCCMPIKILEWESVYGMPVGETMYHMHTDCAYWNFSYTFKTKDVAREHYLRMCRAYRRFYKDDGLGHDDRSSWEQFMEMTYAKYVKTHSEAALSEIPWTLRGAIQNLKPEEKGFNFWGEV